ncbi:MAG: hypothetical protein ACI4I2_10175 [Oscillospiraceae bacterium]
MQNLLAKCIATMGKGVYNKRKRLSNGGKIMGKMDNNVNVQENMESTTNGLEDMVLKKSTQKRKKKSKSTKKSSSNKNIEKSKFIDELNLLINNKEKILSCKSGKKAFKRRRDSSYKNFVRIMKEYNANNGRDDLYLNEVTAASRDKYLEWLYGLKEFKKGIGISDLSRFNKYYFDFIIDAPYVFYDKVLRKTYLYIELHYYYRTKVLLINSQAITSDNLLYRVIVNCNELESFKKEVILSQKLAMLKSKRSFLDDFNVKYTFYHDSDDTVLSGLRDEAYHFYKEDTHVFGVSEFSNRDKKLLKDQIKIFSNVLNQFDLMELWGLLINYKFAYPVVDYNTFYFISGKANNSVAVNLIYRVLGLLKIKKNEIPIIVNPNKKMVLAYKSFVYKKGNLIKNPNIRGIIVLKNAAVSNQTGLWSISFQEYRCIEDFIKWLNKESELRCICYDRLDKRLFNYLLVIAKYNSTNYNEKSLAAFNGLFYFYNYFIKSGVIEYEELFKVFKSVFGVDIDKNEVIKLKLLYEDDILFKEENATLQCELQEEDTYLSKPDDELNNEQQGKSLLKQLDKEDIENVYISVCKSIYKTFKIYDNQDKEKKQQIEKGKTPFIKRFKKYNRYALCFLGEENIYDSFLKGFLGKTIQEIYNNVVDENFIEMLYNCILTHNRSIREDTVGSSNNLKKIVVVDNRRYYTIILDGENLDT